MLRTKIAYIPILFILFGAFFPGIKFFNINFKIDFLVFLFCFSSILLLKLDSFLRLNSFLFVPVSLFSMFLFLGIVSGYFRDSFELLAIRSFVYPLVKGWIIINFIIIFSLKKYNSNNFYLLNRVFLICLFIDGMFRVLELMFPSLKLWWLNIITIDEWWNNTMGYRNLGFKGVSIYDYAFACMVCVLIDFSFKIKRISNYIIYPVLISFSLMSGRTSLIVLLVFLVVFFNDFKGKISIIGIVFCIFVLCIIIINPPFIYNKELQWVLEPLLNIANGKFETESTDDLLNNHLYFPDNIWGYGVWAQFGDLINNRFRGSDSGFILVIVFSGWLGFTAYILSVILMSLQFLLSGGVLRLEKKIYLFFLVSILAVMIKGPIIFSEYVSMLCFIVISPIYFLRIRVKDERAIS